MIWHSLKSGWDLVRRFPSSLSWVYLAMLVLVLPMAAAMGTVLERSIGSSLAHERLRAGFDMAWYGEFSQSSSGLARSFSPEVVGFLPVVANLERFLDGEVFTLDWSILATGISFLLVWAFFSGGILSRYLHPGEAADRSRFFADSATRFFSFVRLLLLSAAAYWAVFRWLARPLHDAVEAALIDVTEEFTSIAWTAAVYALVALVLALWGMVLDYSRIALVAQRRRSALLSVLAGIRFVASRPLQTAGLYLLLCLIGGILFGVYGVLAPGPGQAGIWSVSAAFLGGQAFILARLFLKLWFWAGQASLYRAAVGGSIPAAPVST